jgi:hypothetical protein
VTAERRAYLVIIIDLFSWQVVGVVDAAARSG